MDKILIRWKGAFKMKTTTKIWLFAAVFLIVLGLVVFAFSMKAAGTDFEDWSTQSYVTNTYEISENFRNISVNSNTADIEFLPSENDICKIVSYENEKIKCGAFVKNETLIIEYNDTRQWYDHIGIFSLESSVTVYLPEDEYADLIINGDTSDVYIPADFTFESISIALNTGDIRSFAGAAGNISFKTSTGDIYAENISAASLDLTTETGDIKLSNVICHGDITHKTSTGKTHLNNITCKSLGSSGDTGDLTMSSVIAQESFTLERTTGDINFDKCDAADITVTTDTGDVSGTLLTAKIFFTETDTGSVVVPKSTEGGICSITSDTGDINIDSLS